MWIIKKVVNKIYDGRINMIVSDIGNLTYVSVG